ncbi:MAG: hypothetical protein AAF648_16640, partial [Pseudomonadota bacterium]
MAEINTKAKRSRLRTAQPSDTGPGDRPIFQPIGAGVSLGWRPSSGKWVARWFVDGKERQRALKAWSDDKGKADGVRIMNFTQASRRALELATSAGDVAAEAMTVDDVFEHYRKDRETRLGRDTTDSLRRYRKWIKPTFGSRRVSELRAPELIDWQHMIAAELSSATVQRTSTIFKAVLRYGCEKRQIVSRDPVPI